LLPLTENGVEALFADLPNVVGGNGQKRRPRKAAHSPCQATSSAIYFPSTLDNAA
jgi:hypothetical protein